MGEIVNLRRARKNKAKSDRDAQAAGNRAAHGVSKAARAEAEARRDLDGKRLDGHRREPPDAS